MKAGTRARALLLLAAASVVTFLARPASATGADADVTRLPVAELRVLAGLGVAVEGAASLVDHRLRVEAGAQGFFADGIWLDGAALLRLVGAPRSALWLRGGVGFQHVKSFCVGGSPDDAGSLDVGLAYRHRFAAGHLLAAEAGVEGVSRGHAHVCGDSVLEASSVGPRFGLSGQWALSPSLAVFARAGLRMADHLYEIHVLPEAFAGLAFEL
jgi:hypothetical protein